MDDIYRTYILLPNKVIPINAISNDINLLNNNKQINNIIIELNENIVATTKKDYTCLTIGKSVDRKKNYEAVLGNNYKDSYKLNDIITIFDMDYIVVGFSFNNDIIEINYSEILYDLDIHKIHIISEKSGSLNNKQLTKTLNTYNNNFTIKKPERFNILNIFQNKLFFYILLNIILLSILSYILCFNFIYQQQYKIFNVYKILGSTKKLILIIVTLIMLIFIIFVSLISSIIFNFLDLYILSKSRIIILSDYRLNIQDYYNVFLIYLFFTILLMPFLYNKSYWNYKRKAL